MATVHRTIAFTDRLNDWVLSRIEAGDYADDSEYIRDLIRRDREQHGNLTALRAAIEEGLNSGVSQRSVSDILNEKEAKLKQDGRL